MENSIDLTALAIIQRGIENHTDMLSGCICRLNVSDDVKELRQMYESALNHLERLYDARRFVVQYEQEHKENQ